MTQKDVEAKEETIYKFFHSFKYIIYHASFLLYFLRDSSHSLNDVYSLQYSVYTLQQFV